MVTSGRYVCTIDFRRPKSGGGVGKRRKPTICVAVNERGDVLSLSTVPMALPSKGFPPLHARDHHYVHLVGKNAMVCWNRSHFIFTALYVRMPREKARNEKARPHAAIIDSPKP